MPATNYAGQSILNQHLRNNGTPLTPTTVYAGLFTVAPTVAGGGTEISTSTGYARKPVTFGAPVGKVVTNTNELNFGVATAQQGPTVAWGIFDALTTGNLLYFAPIASMTAGVGGSLVLAAGAVSVTID